MSFSSNVKQELCRLPISRRQEAAAELYALIERLNREDKITVLMISHDIEAALRYADHILHIGQQVFYGTKEDYLKSAAGRLFVSMEGGTAE